VQALMREKQASNSMPRLGLVNSSKNLYRFFRDRAAMHRNIHTEMRTRPDPSLFEM